MCHPNGSHDERAEIRTGIGLRTCRNEESEDE
jgi:hypothetical protein